MILVKTVPSRHIEIANPKRYLNPVEAQGRKLFPYYAGFSESFVESTVASIGLPHGSTVLDPWNGSGTTTSTVLKHGFKAIGSDLNPAMILVAKAALVSKLDIASLTPLAHSILGKKISRIERRECDPLCNWFSIDSAHQIRKLETRINLSLLSNSEYIRLDTAASLENATPLASFFYLALFRVTRRLAKDFVASNPTWIKVPKLDTEKKVLKPGEAEDLFIKEVTLLQEHHHFLEKNDLDKNKARFILANAENLTIESESIDAIITSPPYCTRIDYAVATYIELAVMRIGGEQFSTLRRALTGSSTINKKSFDENKKWGSECLSFLKALGNHTSKASNTYYLKNHTQYFDSLYKSLCEVSRVLKPSAPCIIVVQNSYYKEIRNDIAKIICEMSEGLNLRLTDRADFNALRSMVDVNKNSKKYLGKRSTIESVLFFEKNNQASFFFS